MRWTAQPLGARERVRSVSLPHQHCWWLVVKTRATRALREMSPLCAHACGSPPTPHPASHSSPPALRPTGPPYRWRSRAASTRRPARAGTSRRRSLLIRPLEHVQPLHAADRRVVDICRMHGSRCGHPSRHRCYPALPQRVRGRVRATAVAHPRPPRCLQRNSSRTRVCEARTRFRGSCTAAMALRVSRRAQRLQHALSSSLGCGRVDATCRRPHAAAWRAPALRRVPCGGRTRSPVARGLRVRRLTFPARPP